MSNKTTPVAGAPHTRWSSIVGRYRQALRAIEKVKADHFRPGTQVDVSHPRYTGFGIVVTDGDCWPDHVAVLLPNGNVWRYPIEHVRPHGEVRPLSRHIPADDDESEAYEKWMEELAETCKADQRPCAGCLQGSVCDGPDR